MKPGEPVSKLEEIDQEIIALLNRRYALTTQQKTDENNPLPLQFPPPSLKTTGPLKPEMLQAIYREIHSAENALKKPQRTVYLGPEGTFTHQAALAGFGHSVPMEGRQTVADVFDDVARERADYGVVPVENSTEGAVTDTYDLFYEYAVFICAEIQLNIHHHLLACIPPDEIKEIYSHPQVFGQCRRWLQRYFPQCRLIEMSSTTAAAQRAVKEAHGAALAGTLAAERYGLNIIHEKIEDYSENVTRFLVLNKASMPPSGDDKTSIMLAVQDRIGALYDALLPFKQNHINMTLIHSRPSKRRNWEYHFFIDFLGHIEDPAIRATLDDLSPYCKFVKHLGSYPRQPNLLRG